MKKIFNLSIMALIISASLIFATSCSDDDNDDTTVEDNTSLRFSELPNTAQLFVENHFEEKDVDQILRNTSEGTAGYNVSVKGYKIDFDKNGIWKKIEAKDKGALPANIMALIPTPITGYVDQNYPARGINEIKKKDYGYNVKVAGKPEVELKFDFDGQIFKVDEDKDDDQSQSVSIESLPQVSQTFVKTHFPTSVVKKVKKDNDSYKVEFTDKTDLEFYASGEWKKVETDNNIPVPQTLVSLLPEKARTYITTTYPNKTIKEIENKQSIYEVELYKNIDITFDKEGNIWSESTNDDSDDNSNQSRITFESLPQAIKDFVNTHFANIAVQYVNKTNDEFKIGLIDGTRMDFTFDNNVQAIISVRSQGIPSAAVQPAIAEYVNKNYPNKKMTVYVKKNIGYVVELSGYPVSKLFFDLKGSILRAY